MISKNEVKYIQSFQFKKNRDAEGVFIAEGPKLINELIMAGFSFKALYAIEEWQNTNKLEVQTITSDELKKISLLQTPNQVLGLVKQKEIAGSPEFKNNIVLALDGIQDPGNLGTILRIADWFGINQVIAGTDTVEVYNPKVVQSTMGSIARVKVWYEPLEKILRDLPVPVYGALLDGENVKNMSSIKEGVLIIGNESQGIRDNILPFIQHAITIPRYGNAESLNAAVATGILLSHITP